MDNTVAILACAKNCAQYLPSTMSNIHNIGSLYKDYHVFIYENDSKDGTDSLVRKYNNHPKVTGINETGVKLSYRTWCIAHGRNTVLKALIDSKFNPEYVIVIDMDDIGAKTNFRGLEFVKNSMNLKEHWDGIFPNHDYDLWAYRVPGILKNFWQMQVRPIGAGGAYEKFVRKRIWSTKFDKNGLSGIYSGFNGIAIYKYNIYIKGTYCGKNIYFARYKHNDKYEGIIGMPGFNTVNTKEECEHVNFHKSLGPCRLMMSNINYP